MSQEPQRISIIIPVYNEAENIGLLLKSLTVVLDERDYQIIVVDDNSPDGTHLIVQNTALGNRRIQGIQRPSKLGLASAVLEGFQASDGDIIVMMDADFSHRPQDLTYLVEEVSNADIVIGSRYIEGGSITGWSPFRHLASRTAIWLSKTLLGLTVKDTTSGFAIFKKEILNPIAPEINPIGFKLLLEVLVRSPSALIKESPITFVNRKKGKSKFGVGETIAFLQLLMELRRHQKKRHSVNIIGN